VAGEPTLDHRTGSCHPGQPFSKQAVLSILKNITTSDRSATRARSTLENSRPLWTRAVAESEPQLEGQRWPEQQRAGKPALLKVSYSVSV